MKTKNLIRFAQSLVLLPMVTTSFSIANLQNAEVSQNVLAKINIETDGLTALNQAVSPEVKMFETRARAVDAYFEKRGMPLAGTGEVMVRVAEKNGLDWRLLPAIAVRESTGGKNACKRVKNNPFGWGSCKIGFESMEQAIETVAHNLGGNNPNTARHYDDKTTRQILNAYNPPSIVPRYAEQVLSIMKAIGPEDFGEETEITAT